MPPTCCRRSSAAAERGLQAAGDLGLAGPVRELHDRRGAGTAAIDATETALKDAAAAGISVLGASGDYGSADCAAHEHQASRRRWRSWPSTIPPRPRGSRGRRHQLHAQLAEPDQQRRSSGTTATAIPGNAGGGGFSKLFARPSYQNGTVASRACAAGRGDARRCLRPATTSTAPPSLDCHGRGWATFGGTSAATPLLAGGFALIDELLRRHDKPSLGLRQPAALQARTQPDQRRSGFLRRHHRLQRRRSVHPADGRPLGCCSAQPGYDEASGWGGVNLEGLSQAAVQARPDLAQVHMRLPVQHHPYKNGGISVIVSCSAACDLAG